MTPIVATSYWTRSEARREGTATITTTGRIAAHLTGHYTADQIAAGVAYAEGEGYTSSSEALSLMLSRILYSDDQLAAGARYGTGPDSW